MRRSNYRIGEGGRWSAGWTSNHGGGWSNIALNGGLGIRTWGNLRRGKGESLLTSAFTLDGRNILLNRWRIENRFIWLLIQFNDVGAGVDKAGVKGFFFIGHECTKAIQVPTTFLQVWGWKLCNLHGGIDTKIGVDIDPIKEESEQGRRRQNILHKELAGMYLKNEKHGIRKWPWEENERDEKIARKILSVSNAFDGDGAFVELEEVKAFTKC
jgi:hypothetical protein